MVLSEVTNTLLSPESERMISKISPPTPNVLDCSIACALLDEMEKIDPVEVLTEPNVLSLLPAEDIGRLGTLNKEFKKRIYVDSLQSAWYYACANFASVNQLYLPMSRLQVDKDNWKMIFFNQLLICKNKWVEATVAEEEEQASSVKTQSFKINVAARFRPGERKEKSVLLPLHQRLKLLRKQQKEGGSGMLGSKMPQEYLDPIMGNVMNSPVKLPSSGKTVERKVVLAQVKRNPIDPFDGSPLTPDMLVVDLELKNKIVEYKEKRKTSMRGGSSKDCENEAGSGKTDDDEKDNFRVDSDDIKALTSCGGEITPELLTALLEADRLENSIKTLNEEMSMNACKKVKKEGGSEEEEGAGEGEEGEEGAETTDNVVTTSLKPANLREMEKKIEEKAKENDLEQIIGNAHKKEARILAVEKSRTIMLVDGIGIRPFLFDGGCYSATTKQDSLYSTSGKYSVMSALNGFNACLLAYGQTGSGKTHTIFGPEGVIERSLVAARESEERGESAAQITRCVERVCDGGVGLAIRACCDLAVGLKLDNHFNDGIKGSDHVGKEVEGKLNVQYVQIYNEKVSCLLGSETAVHLRGEALQGARTVSINSIVELLNLLLVAESNKKRAATAMNERSSRSHSILIFNVTQKNSRTDTVIKSTLHLVDLAGSERLKKSKVEGLHKAEAIGINGSLLVLGKVINALVEKKRHVPYYESKLTTLLKQSIGGNSRTTALVCARMDDSHGPETLQSLRFGERCASVSNAVATAATNATEALKQIEVSLKTCEETMQRFRERNMTHLPAFKQVEEKYRLLVLKKAEF